MPPYLEIVRRVGQGYHKHKLWGIRGRSEKGKIVFYANLVRTPGLRNTHHHFDTLNGQPYLIVVRQNCQDITPHQPLRLLLIPAPDQTLAYLEARQLLARLPRLRLPQCPPWAIALRQAKVIRNKTSIFL
ncbi:hypothetical protein DYU11_25265 [Fibrisoma montanum]|uniref:Uncharacterized protein n=2 Tax=Fibrisoma montanum TaxID=2305895 RepID=A0A418M1C1_9BACT|nr:hypothetical protein DYU11_25265 [Fibrisoma montanum]